MYGNITLHEMSFVVSVLQTVLSNTQPLVAWLQSGMYGFQFGDEGGRKWKKKWIYLVRL